MPKYKLMADGRYMTRVWDGTYKDGKKHYKAISSRKSSRDLELKVIEFCANVKTGGEAISSDATFYEYACDWVQRSKQHAEKSTLQWYVNIIERYLSEVDCPLNQINARELQNVININSEIPRTCQNIKLVIKQVLKSAELERFIPRGKTDDIFTLMSFPKAESKEKRPLTDEEKTALVNADFSPFERALIMTLYYTGIRREEALALTKSDIQGGVLKVNKAVGYIKNQPYIKQTKSKRGNRSIPITKALSEILESYTADMSNNQLLFAHNGEPMTAGIFYSHWRKMLKKMKPYLSDCSLTPHMFRHNFCTMLCYQSIIAHTITTKKIAELLGDTEDMVIKVYSHIISDYEHPEDSIEEALKL